MNWYCSCSSSYVCSAMAKSHDSASVGPTVCVHVLQVPVCLLACALVWVHIYACMCACGLCRIAAWALHWQGGVQLRKGTVVLVAGLGDDPQNLKETSKCVGLQYRMVAPGTRHHVVGLCQPSSRKLHLGQRLVDPQQAIRDAHGRGVYARFMRLHLAWLQLSP